MIAAVAVCPHPPLLFRELTGTQDVAADLRAACVAAITVATDPAPDRVVVVGGADHSGAWDPTLPPEVATFGTTGGRPAAPGLPLSLGVARRLLQESGWQGAVELHAIAWDAADPEVDALAGAVAEGEGRTVLVVLGDGSGRRGDKAPGYIDERAFPFDDATGRALSEGDVESVLGMDAVLSAELMVSCRAPFAVMATAVRREGAAPRARMLYRDDPFGVMYFVATWELV